MPRVLKMIIGVGCLLVLLAGAAWHYGEHEVFSKVVLAKLKPGMSTNEVLSILGNPSAVSSDHWIYYRSFSINIGRIYFDESNHLTSAIND